MNHSSPEDALSRCVRKATVNTLQRANAELGTSFSDWLVFADSILERSPEEALLWENAKIDELIRMQSAEGLSAADCTLMEKKLKEQTRAEFRRYLSSLPTPGPVSQDSLTAAHIELVIAVQLIDGVLSDKELLVTAEVVSEGLEITKQELGDMMAVATEELAKLNEDDKQNRYISALKLISRNAKPEFKACCYEQYAAIARSDGLHHFEARFLGQVRREWGVESSRPHALSNTSTESKDPVSGVRGKPGCALFGLIFLGSLGACF